MRDRFNAAAARGFGALPSDPPAPRPDPFKALRSRAPFDVIYADPPWRYETWSAKGKGRSVDGPLGHYGTMALDEIKTLPVASIAKPRAVLFLWAINPMLPQALAVMESWGFRYKANYCWDKELIGLGYWNRSRHELLLIGTRGSHPAPAPGDRIASLYRERRRRHSAKPSFFRDWIEIAWPDAVRVELFARGLVSPAWSVWGNQAERGSE